MITAEHLHERMERMPPRIGEKLCLDFVNTIEPRGTPYLSAQQRATQYEYLTNYNDFLAWSILAGLMTEEEAVQLSQQASLLGTGIAEIYTQIIELRERLYALFWHITSSQEVPEQELEWLRNTYLNALSHARLTRAEKQYIWQWNIKKEHLLSPTWPIIQSAFELLTGEDLTRLKVCT